MVDEHKDNNKFLNDPKHILIIDDDQVCLTSVEML